MSNHPAPSRVLFDDQSEVLTTDAAGGANLIATADRWRGLVKHVWALDATGRLRTRA